MTHTCLQVIGKASIGNTDPFIVMKAVADELGPHIVSEVCLI
jgi:hypothetical protein